MYRCAPEGREVRKKDQEREREARDADDCTAVEYRAHNGSVTSVGPDLDTAKTQNDMGTGDLDD